MRSAGFQCPISGARYVPPACDGRAVRHPGRQHNARLPHPAARSSVRKILAMGTAAVALAAAVLVGSPSQAVPPDDTTRRVGDRPAPTTPAPEADADRYAAQQPKPYQPVAPDPKAKRPKADRPDFGPHEKIVRAYHRGQLSLDDAVRYGTMSVDSPASVPARLRPTGAIEDPASVPDLPVDAVGQRGAGRVPRRHSDARRTSRTGRARRPTTARPRTTNTSASPTSAGPPAVSSSSCTTSPVAASPVSRRITTRTDGRRPFSTC